MVLIYNLERALEIMKVILIIVSLILISSLNIKDEEMTGKFGVKLDYL